MRRTRSVLADLRRVTLASALVALLAATVLIVVQSRSGVEDTGMGVWWYEYYPFYSYSHGDAVRSPFYAAIYGNLLAVTALVYPAARTVEYALAHEVWADPPTLDRRTAAWTLGLLLGVGTLSRLVGMPLLLLQTQLAAVVLAVVGAQAAIEAVASAPDVGLLTAACAVSLAGWYAAIAAIRRYRSADVIRDRIRAPDEGHRAGVRNRSGEEG